jgi:hypothetical protein
MQMDIMKAKALIGGLMGVVMVILTFAINSVIMHPLSDYILVLVFFMIYVPSLPLVVWLTGPQPKVYTKGISMFYSVEFIVWIVLFDTIMRLTG